MGILDFSLPASDPSNPNAVNVSAADLQRRQALADALLKQGGDYSPVQSPWQGAARMAAALMGGLEGRQLDQQQRDLTASGNADFTKYLSGLGMGNTASASPSPSAYAAAIDPGSSSLPTFASAMGGNTSNAAQQLYSGFYNYARNQGADHNGALEFANLGLGTSANEGLFEKNVWGPTGDHGKSWGPLQLFTGGGLGDGLHGNMSPQNQIQVGASTMWNGAGTDGYYNTRPWNGNGDRLAGRQVGNPDLNDSEAAQTAAIARGTALAAKNNLSLPQVASNNPTQAFAAAAPSMAAAPAASAANAAVQPPAQAISVPGYEGTFTRAQATDATDVPSQAEWDAAAAKAPGVQPAQAPAAAPVQVAQNGGAVPAPQAAPASRNIDFNTALRILNNPYASPAAKQVVAATLQSALKPTDHWQTFERNGSYWQRNTQTGEEKLTQDNSPSEDAYSDTVDASGVHHAFNKRTGALGPGQTAPATYRPMSPQEKQAYGVPADSPAYIGPDGKPSGIGGGTTVNVGADAQTYDKQLAEGLGKSHAALANGVEDAQARARDIAAMQGAVDAIQRAGGTTGFGAQQKLQLQKAINAGANAIGIQEPYEVSDPEFLTKFNRQIAGAQAKGAMGARVTNFEMQNYLKANPGLEMSTTGNQRLLGIQAQIEQRNIEVGNAIRNATAQSIANGQKINPVQVQKIITDYDAAHHITDPVTGQDLTENPTLPEFRNSATGANGAAAGVHQQNIAPAQPKAGSVVGGWRFKGGDPSDKANWEKAQ